MKINSHEPLKKNILHIHSVLKMCILQTIIQKLLSKQQRQLEADKLNYHIAKKKTTTKPVKHSIKLVMKPRQQQPTYFEVIFNTSCGKLQISKQNIGSLIMKKY